MENKDNKKINILIYLYALIMVSVNAIRIFDNAFWFDECFTISLAKMSLLDMVSATAADVHPPLYYLWTRFLYLLFGNNGITYHLSALLPYIAVILITCIIIQKQFGNVVSIIEITMCSIMQCAVTYNVEARMYSLASMFVYISYFSFYKIIKENKCKDWIIFVVSSLCAAYTHYYALVSVAFLYVMLLPIAIKNKNYIKGLGASYIVTIACYLPWLFVLLNQFNVTSGSWWLSEIPTLSECLFFLLDNGFIIASSVIVIILFVLFDIKVLSTEEQRKDRKKYYFSAKNLMMTVDSYWIMSGLFMILGTVAVGLILSYAIRPFFLTRYLFPISSSLYLTIAFCISKMKYRNVICGLFVFLILIVDVPSYLKTYKSDANLNNKTAEFMENVQPRNNAVIVSNHYLLEAICLNYYFPDNIGFYSNNFEDIFDNNYDELWLFLDSEMSSEIDELSKKYGYEVNAIYDGKFANGKYYYVYKLD